MTFVLPVTAARCMTYSTTCALLVWWSHLQPHCHPCWPVLRCGIVHLRRLQGFKIKSHRFELNLDTIVIVIVIVIVIAIANLQSTYDTPHGGPLDHRQARLPNAECGLTSVAKSFLLWASGHWLIKTGSISFAAA